MGALTLVLAALLAAPLQQEEGGDDAAMRLVQRIQQDLAEVDRLLEQASDAAELEDELADARRAHVRAISDLEELIRQIKYRRGGESSQSSGGGGGGGQSSQPPPREADGRSGADSAEAPQQQGGQPEPQQQGQDQGGQTPQAAPREDTSPGEQRDASAQPPPDVLDDFLRRDTDARWGVLPPKMQERLMNLHVDDVPDRYRAWLEAYVRELNRRDTGSPP